MVLIDSHGYSTQVGTPAGTYVISLAVVIYALLLGGQHRKWPPTQYRILWEIKLNWHSIT